MTDFAVMLNFFAPDVDYVYTSCAECGTPLSVHKQGTKRPLCDDCRREAKAVTSRKKYERLQVMPNRYGDPTVDLVAAIIRHAQEDAAWQRKFERIYDQGTEYHLSECDAGEFLRDGGAELYLRALGIGLQPSLAKAVRTG